MIKIVSFLTFFFSLVTPDVGGETMLKNFRHKLMTVTSGEGGVAAVPEVPVESLGDAISPLIVADDAPVSGFICPQCRRDFPDPESLQTHFLTHDFGGDGAEAASREEAAPTSPPGEGGTKRGSIFKTLSSAAAKAMAPTSTFYSREGEEEEEGKRNGTEDEFSCPLCEGKFASGKMLQDHFDRAHDELDFDHETKEGRTNSTSLVEGIKQQDQVVKDLIQENKELKVSLDEEKWYVEELKKELGKYESSTGGMATSLPEEDQKHQQREEEQQERQRHDRELEEKNKFLQQQLEGNVQQLESLRVSKEAMERKAAELASSVVEFQAKADEADSIKAAKQEEIVQLLAKLNSAEDELQRRRSEDDDAAALKRQLVSVQSVLDEQVRALSDEAAELRSRLEETEEERDKVVREAEEERKRSEEKLEESEARLKEQREELLKKAEEGDEEEGKEIAAVKVLKEELERKEKEVAERKEETDRLRAEMKEEGEKRKAEAIDAREALEAAREAARAEVETLNKEKKDNEELKVKLEDMTKANEEMGEKYLRALEESSEKEAGVMAELHRLKEANAEAEEEQGKLKNKLEDKRRNEQLINKKLVELEMIKQEQSEKLTKQEDKLKHHESQVAEWSSREIAMESALLQKEGVQRDLQKQVEVLTIRLTEAQSQVSSLEAQQQELQSRIAEFEKGMESLEKELSTTQSAFEETKRREAEARTNFEAAVEEKRALEEKVKEAEAKHREEEQLLREAKHTLIADKVEMGRKVEEMEEELKGKRKDLKDLLAETSEERSRLDSEIKRLKEDSTKSEEKWRKEEDSLKVELSVKDTKLSLLLENVSTLEQELQKLDKSKDDAWSEKLEIEARVSILEDEKRLLGERCISAEARIDEQKTRLKSLVAEKESLQCAAEELARENQMLQMKQAQIQSRKWTDDSDIDTCSSCSKTFSITFRKHHCRNCGGVFCADCTENTAPVPSFKKPQRVCEICYNELKS